MSTPSPDVRAVVAAVDRLTTQVRRLADTRPTDTDAPATTPDDGPTRVPPAVYDAALRAARRQDFMAATGAGPRCVCGDPIELTGDPAGWIHSPGSNTPCLDARPNLPGWIARGTRDLSIPDPSTSPGTVVGHWFLMSEQQAEEMNQASSLIQQWAADAYKAARAADEEQQRTERRRSLRVLINRVNRGLALTPDEAQLLARHVATEICDAGDGRRARAELEQAQAAIARVRTLRDPIADAIERADYSGNMRRGDLADSVMPVIRAALDGTEQPTTKEPS